MSNEKTLDGFLGDKLKIFQLKNGYRAGHDAVILASSIKAKKGDNCLELGLGSGVCLLYTSPSPRDGLLSRMPSSA